MNYEVKQINVWSAIKVSFIINAILGVLLGLLVGLIMLFFSALISRLAYLPGGQTDFGLFTGVASIIIFPVIYGVFGGIVNGIIVTGLFCLIYNLIARATGGVVLELKGAELPPQQAAPTTYQRPEPIKEPTEPPPPPEERKEPPPETEAGGPVVTP